MFERTGPAAVSVGRTLLSATINLEHHVFDRDDLSLTYAGSSPILHVQDSCISAPGGRKTNVDSSSVTPIAAADCLIPCSTCSAT